MTTVEIIVQQEGIKLSKSYHSKSFEEVNKLINEIKTTYYISHPDRFSKNTRVVRLIFYN